MSWNAITSTFQHPKWKLYPQKDPLPGQPRPGEPALLVCLKKATSRPPDFHYHLRLLTCICPLVQCLPGPQAACDRESLMRIFIPSPGGRNLLASTYWQWWIVLLRRWVHRDLQSTLESPWSKYLEMSALQREQLQDLGTVTRWYSPER